MMKYYGVESRFSAMKEWYDGYMFGKTQVYNPWNAVNHMCDLYADIKAFPRPYWINSSSNDIIKDILAISDFATSRGTGWGSSLLPF